MLELINTPPAESLLYVGEYNAFLVAVSLAVAIFSCFAALRVSDLVAELPAGMARRKWLTAGGMTMGVGIWTMHFVGMLAFKLPCAVNYSPWLTAASVVPGILACILALRLVARSHTGLRAMLLGGLLIGLGIGTMHYSGMAAMRLDGVVRYDRTLFLLSVVVAVLLAVLALWAKLRLLPRLVDKRWQNVLAALILGGAISGMHYTAMAAAYFIRDNESSGVPSALTPTLLAATLALTTLSMVIVTMAAVLARRADFQIDAQRLRPLAVLIVIWLLVAAFAAKYYNDATARKLVEADDAMASREMDYVAFNVRESLDTLHAVPLALSQESSVRQALRLAAESVRRDTEDVVALRHQLENQASLQPVNDFLKVQAAAFVIDVVWLIDRNGVGIAASNAGTEGSFVGANYGERSYFRSALAGQPGKQYAVGKVSGIPGLYFSQPVRDGGRVIGAVVAKINVSELNKRLVGAGVLMGDANGVVILAPRPEQLWRTLPGAAAEHLSDIEREQLYRQARLDPLPLRPWGERMFPQLRYLGGTAVPVLVKQRDFSEVGISLLLPHPLSGWGQLEESRSWLFILLAVAGGFLILSVYGGWYYINAMRDANQALAGSLRQLEVSEKRFRLLLDAMAEGIYGTDEKGRCIFVNRACLEMLGYAQADDMLGQLVHDQIHHSHTDGSPYPFDDCPAYSSRLSEQGVHVDHEVFWKKDGSAIPVEYWGRPVFDNGVMVGTVVAWFDISEQRAAEDRLRKLSQAVEQSPNAILITDTGGRIEYVNEAFCRISGYTVDELLGQNPRLLQSGFTPPEVYEAMWAALTQGRSWNGELINRRKNGEVFIEYQSFSPIRQADGRVTHYLAIKEDITEKKRTAEELARYRSHLEELVAERTREIELLNAQLAERAVEAESANQAKSSFLANMSHEIRTPLNAITGMVHLLKRDTLSDKQRERLGKIETAGQHLLALINDILDLSKIEAGKLMLESVPVHVGALVADVASIASERAQAKSLQINVSTEGLPRNLLGDPTRLRQGLLNYVTNAIKFTEVGGVTLRVRLFEDRGDRVVLRFEVQDSGPGIPEAVQARLFGAFEQADNSTTREHGGTGLGLNITRRLAQLMGGDAGVSSRLGEGSLFWFTACLSKADAVQAEGGAARAEGGADERHRGARILLVEDEPINGEIAVEILQEAGFVVDVAEDGVEAVLKAGETSYGVILMDMQMPRMDGVEATQRIRRSQRGARVPIVAMTANAFAEDRSRCFDAGMDDFLTKPINPDMMLATVRKWLSQAR
ncbi:MHYT domain-containing protein [Azonexus sp. IMCC34839]|uniref:MHYT domain-containing protein n=1 Tax=Azonexus sp. IMCC34839 TaxID=3133695 RepID=UPI0039996D7F